MSLKEWWNSLSSGTRLCYKIFIITLIISGIIAFYLNSLAGF